MAGVRYLYLHSLVYINYIKEVEEFGTAWNGIVGLKGRYGQNEKWFIPFHFDVGTGEVDLTWQAYAGVGYKYDNWDVVAGYRYLEWKFDDSDDGGEKYLTL